MNNSWGGSFFLTFLFCNLLAQLTFLFSLLYHTTHSCQILLVCKLFYATWPSFYLDIVTTIGWLVFTWLNFCFYMKWIMIGVAPFFSPLFSRIFYHNLHSNYPFCVLFMPILLVYFYATWPSFHLDIVTTVGWLVVMWQIFCFYMKWIIVG